MHKNTYLRKLAIAEQPVRELTTIAELKLRNKMVRELKAFWRKAALKWMEENVWKMTYSEFESGWAGAAMKATLKPNGTVEVETFGSDQSWCAGYTKNKVYVIPKKELFD